MSGELLREFLRPLLRGRVAVLGVGNILRGDDGFGIALVQRLAERGLPLLAVDAGTVPENHVAVAARFSPDTVLLADCLDHGGLPGDVAVLAGEELSEEVVSTHGFPLSMLMDEIARRTGAAVRLLGVQPADLTLGAELSPPVLAALDHLESLFADLLAGPEA